MTNGYSSFSSSFAVKFWDQPIKRHLSSEGFFTIKVLIYPAFGKGKDVETIANNLWSDMKEHPSKFKQVCLKKMGKDGVVKEWIDGLKLDFLSFF